MKLLDYSVPMNTIIHIYNFEGGRNKNGQDQGKLLTSRDLAACTVQIYHKMSTILTL
jgi:hypothetical protein